MKRKCLFLDDKTIVFLDELKYDLKNSKSEIIRKVFHYFIENREEIVDIINKDENY